MDLMVGERLYIFCLLYLWANRFGL